MIIKGIKIGKKTSKYPIIQGGMGIGISGYKLAGTVASEGGIGVLSAASMGYKNKDFLKNPLGCNLKAMDEEIKKAREISEKGILGINIMVAMSNYAKLVKNAVKAKIDLIISGAGLPSELPELVKDSDTKIAPIVSSGRAARLIMKLWKNKHNYTPDLIIVEGPLAGGHLGFKEDEINNKSLEEITLDVLNEVKTFEKENNTFIPVIAAGGIKNGEDIYKFLNLGASGVQMGTEFIKTIECDASIEFKNKILNITRDDIVITKSPVGMPGRAVENVFVNRVKEGRILPKRCFDCIVTCDPKTTRYCITDALINAVEGKLDEALIFCGGGNHRKSDRLISVKELIMRLINELNAKIVSSV